jgi:hypothetical protein
MKMIMRLVSWSCSLHLIESRLEWELPERTMCGRRIPDKAELMSEEKTRELLFANAAKAILTTRLLMCSTCLRKIGGRDEGVRW